MHCPIRHRMRARLTLRPLCLNNTIAYRGTFAQGIGRIVGGRVRFKGTGVVQKFELKKAE